MQTTTGFTYPALIKASRSIQYHITQDGHTTLCNHKIVSFPERHPLDLEEKERCPVCAKRGNIDAINQARANEQTAAQEAFNHQMAQIAYLREARNAARPSLVDGIKRLLSVLAGDAILHKTFSNMDDLKLAVTWQGERFTLKIAVWNGDKE